MPDLSGEALDSRIRTALALYAFFLLGILLVIMPWTAVWAHVASILLPPALKGWVMSGWLRGVVSGLGALDLAVAAQVARELFRGMNAGDDTT